MSALKACSALLAYLSMDDAGLKFRSLVQPCLQVQHFLSTNVLKQLLQGIIFECQRVFFSLKLHTCCCFCEKLKGWARQAPCGVVTQAALDSVVRLVRIGMRYMNGRLGTNASAVCSFSVCCVFILMVLLVMGSAVRTDPLFAPLLRLTFAFYWVTWREGAVLLHVHKEATFQRYGRRPCGRRFCASSLGWDEVVKVRLPPFACVQLYKGTGPR